MTQSQQLNANRSPGESNEVASELPWAVYAIAPEGDEGNPFYIGITMDPVRRAREHNGAGSACYDVSQAYEALGRHCSLVPFARFATQREALECETILIALRTRLSNRNVATHVRATLERYGEFSA